MDVFPTLAAAAGIEPAGDRPLDGRDLWTAIRDGKTAPPKNLVFASGPHRAILDGEWKWIEMGGGTESYLIHLDKDPAERWDLTDEHPEVVRRLRAQLAPWMETERPQQRFNPPGPGRRRGFRRWAGQQ